MAKENIQSVSKGFAISLGILIVYLSIYGLDKKLSIIWLLSIPFIFILMIIYELHKHGQITVQDAVADFYFALGGPFSIIGFIAAFYFIVEEIKNEKHEKSIPKEGNGDTRHDEQSGVLQKEEKKKQDKIKKIP